MKARRLPILLLTTLIAPVPADMISRVHAADLGVHGQIWPITEASLLSPNRPSPRSR